MALVLAGALLLGGATTSDSAAQALEDTPDPALVPDPPEGTPGLPSDEETLIELPIAPPGTGADEPEETEDALAPAPAVSAPNEAAAAVGDLEDLENLRVLFPEGGTVIDEAAESELAGLAGYMSANQGQRVVLHAYAGGAEQGRSDARRLSLTRALAVRSFLVDRGVPVERIYLRPLGNNLEDGPPDRVDILPLRP